MDAAIEAESFHIGIPVQEVLAMKLETAAKFKYGIWGLICGGVIAMIVGFSWGGWSTSGSTQTMTKEAVLASQAAICVAQFMKQPNHERTLKNSGQWIAGGELKSSKRVAGIRCPVKKRLAMP